MSNADLFLWKGKKSSELSIDELMEVISYLSKENQDLKKDRDAIFKHVDIAAYLMDKP